MSTSLVADIIQELTCAICSELAINPVRLKITEDQKQSICNDVFCEICVIQMFYHYQRSDSRENIKCPICSQKILVGEAQYVADCYVEDKIAKKIIENLLRENSSLCEYTCKYNCGFTGKNIDEIGAHYKGDPLKCNKRIVKCSTEICPHIDMIGKAMYDHEKKCPYKYIICPFCATTIENTKNDFVDHAKTYHRLTTIDIFVALMDAKTN